MDKIKGIAIYNASRDGEFVLTIDTDNQATSTHDISPEYLTRNLTFKDLVDLEGRITWLRMQHETELRGDVKKTAPASKAKIARFAKPAPVVDLDDPEDEDDYDDDDLVMPAKKAKTPYKSPPSPAQEWTTVAEIGTLVDNITGNSRRSPERVARRALEEMTEVCLAAGCSSATIINGVFDAIHNQCLKASADDKRTVFPSQFHTLFDRRDLTKEIADTWLVLNDLMHVAGIEKSKVRYFVNDKYRTLKAQPARNFVTDGHTFYLRKPHVNGVL